MTPMKNNRDKEKAVTCPVLSRRSYLLKSGAWLLSAVFTLNGINLYAQENSMKPRCTRCSLRARYDANPKSFTGRLWKWHITWCPGWKKYLAGLTETEREKIIGQYR